MKFEGDCHSYIVIFAKSMYWHNCTRSLYCTLLLVFLWDNVVVVVVLFYFILLILGLAIYIYNWVKVTLNLTWSNVTSLNIFQLNANFDKSIIRLHYFRIFSMLAKFKDNKKLIATSSINFLNSSLCSLK